MRKLVMIKFGGSFITDKRRQEAANKRNINTLAAQFKKILEKNPKTFFLIGTGAGSFGHIYVKKYHLTKGIKTFEKKLGFSLTEDSVARLNQLVVTSLLQHQIPVVSIKPSSIFMNENARVKKIFITPLTGFLNLGIVPLVYGDMVYDEVLGASVLSTDTEFSELIFSLSKSGFSVDKIVFCGATDGVLDENGKTIAQINKKTYPLIKSVFFKNPYVDVTGGMKRKVEIALKIADLGIKSYIINGTTLVDCLNYGKFSGTEVL